MMPMRDDDTGTSSMPTARRSETEAEDVVPDDSTFEALGQERSSGPAARVPGPHALPPARKLRRSRRGKGPGVAPTDPLCEAGRKILRFHFEVMLAKEAGTIAG